MDTIKKYMRQYRATHRTEIRRSQRVRYARNAVRLRQEAKARYQSRTPEQKKRQATRQAAQHLRRKYKLTPEAKQKIYENQRGLCYLCHRPLISCLSANVDHNHYTDEIRGLAHPICNRRLGWIEKAWHDDPQTLNRLLAIAGVKRE
jgi:5-methylcytosine-specific restriction endonuclease McrA